MSGSIGAPAAGRHTARFGEIIVSLVLIALGAFVIVETQGIRETQSAAGVGPRLFPNIVGSGLALIGSWLGLHALVGGWRDLPDIPQHAHPDWLAFAGISLGVLLHMPLIGWAGFIVASTLLFALVAFGFGSRRVMRDLLIAVLVSVLVFVLFTQVLGLSLPAGLFEGVFGR